MATQNEDLALMDEYMSSGKEMLDILRKQTLSTIYSKYGVSEKSAIMICDMEDSVIDSLTYQNLDEYLLLVGLNSEEIQKKRSKQFRGDISLLEYTKEMLRDVKEEMGSVLKHAEDLKDISNEVSSVKQDYIDFVHSKKFADIQKKRLAEMKSRIEMTTDENERNELRKKIEFVENLKFYKFLTKRLETLGEKEVKRLMNQFFSNSLGDFTMKKFQAACKKFHLAKDIHTYFINLEEQFLPEEYSPLNNMFLFVVMAFVSYADERNPDECAYVDKLFNSMILLIQHRFQGDEEELFIDLIKRVDDYFMPYISKYREDNVTWKEHPERITAGERVERRKRDELLRRLKLRGIDADPSTDSVTLQNMLDESIKKTFATKKPKLNTEEPEAEESEEEVKEESETGNESTEEESEETPNVLQLDQIVDTGNPDINLEDCTITTSPFIMKPVLPE